MFIAFALAAASTTNAQPARIIDVDGEKVSYAASRTVDGKRRYAGERLRDGASFEFIVGENGVVTGHVGGSRVRFLSVRP